MHRRPPSAQSGGKFSDRRRGSASERGYGYEWSKLRRLVLRRDKGLCQLCEVAGRSVVARDVDHIVPKHRGGTDDLGNLQALCASCHKVKTAREGRTAARPTNRQ